MAKLVCNASGSEVEHRLGQDNTIGRQPGSSLQLDDELVSGRHAYLVRDGGKWRLRDLGSSNGTWVNGIRIEHAVLHDGDTVQVGRTTFVFKETAGDEPAKRAKVKVGGENNSAQIHSRVDGRGTEKFVPVQEISDIEQLKQDYEKLRIANELNQAIGLEPDIDVLLNNIIEETFKLLPADRGVIMLMDQASNELVTRAVKQRIDGDDEIVLSSTVVNEVFGTGAAVLTSDAMLDSRFSAAKSVMAMGIRSTMCVPMIYRSQIFGIIHLDTMFARGAFSNKDLQILTGLASQAARGIDNAYKARDLERNALARRDFERLLPPEIVEQVVSGKVQLQRGGELRDTTILFSDIRGFTAWSESHAPDYIVSILNDYFELMVDAIHRHHGTLDKFMGDGIMALFGAPIATENDPQNAVNCALDMLEALKQLNARLKAFQKEQVAIGIGINTGPVIAGYMGSSKSMEYTTIGDHVNLAARLCGAAKPGQILLSENTRRAVASSFAIEAMPPIRVKGKRDPVALFEVVGRLSAESAAEEVPTDWDEITGVTKTPIPE